MATVGVSQANASVGKTATDFGQDVSPAAQEQLILSADAYDATINEQPLEIYMYYAAIERQLESSDTRPIPDSPWGVAFKRLTGKSHAIVRTTDEDQLIHHQPDHYEKQVAYANGGNGFSEKHGLAGETGSDVDRNASGVTSQEMERAYRALRVASWQAVFYLITTDILGFSSAPYAFSLLGLGPGVLVYVFFYILAVGAGQVIWKLYLSMDSPRYPVRCYADLGERTFGKAVRHIFNFFQSFQLLFNVALLIIGSGQTLVTMINWSFCYLALNVFFTLAGIAGGQIRTLRSFALFANGNVWLNIIVMIITIVGIWSYAPVPSQSYHKDLSEPIVVSGWVPSTTLGWYQQVSGVQVAVFAYGGAMIFPEFMAEMRRPLDFWKSALFAQLFCFIVYMFFGLICYVRQGQYTSILPGLDFDNTALILVGNIIGLITTMVAAVLYGNIGVKVFYENVLRAYFRAPAIMSTKGRYYWSITVIVYWTLAWVIGSAIPNIGALFTLVGAACILQFTYTFPPILLLGYWMQVDANKGDNPWVPGMAPKSNRIDSWRDKSRWVRGFRRHWYAKAFLFLLFVAAWANCALGIYAGIETAIQAYASGYLIPFSCHSPNDPAVQAPTSG